MNNEGISFWKLPKETLIGCVVILCYMAFVIFDQSHWWETKTDYSFGYVVPGFVGFILFDRWNRVYAFLFPQKSEGGDSAHKISGPYAWVVGLFFILLLVGGISVFSLGGVLRANVGVSNVSSLFLTMGFSAIFLSIAYFISAKDSLGNDLSVSQRLSFVSIFIFPALIWLVSAPLVASVETRLSLFLMNKVSWVVFESFNILGIALTQEGNILRFPNGETVHVAEACSGIRSLTACLFSGSFLAAVFLKEWWKKMLLVVAASFLAVFTNLIRSMVLTAFAYNFGTDSLDRDLWGSSIHDITGYAVLGLTTILLLCMLPFFNFKQFLANIYIPKEELED